MNDYTYQQTAAQPPTTGLFGVDDSTPAAAHNVPLRATERAPLRACKCGAVAYDEGVPVQRHVCECYQSRGEAGEPQLAADKDATRLEHMAKRLPPPTIEERFAAFVAEHPDVVEATIHACREMKRAGVNRWSIDAAWHVVRFQHHTSAHGGAHGYGDFSLNNDFTAPMARLIMARCPDLAGFFETRKSKVAQPRTLAEAQAAAIEAGCDILLLEADNG